MTTLPTFPARSHGASLSDPEAEQIDDEVTVRECEEENITPSPPAEGQDKPTKQQARAARAKVTKEG